MTLTSLFVLSFVLSLAVTGRLRRTAAALGLVDLPSHRSSHVTPTPRGGGVGFAIAYVLLCVGLLFVAPEMARTWWALLIGGGAVSAIGLLDDRRDVSSRVRFAVHGAAALVAVILVLGQAPWMDDSLPAIAGSVVAWLFVAWSINMYNFMDGIDGLGGGQALIALLAGAGVFVVAGSPALAAFCLIFAGAVGGFLVWNLPPAKIFMGDVGSGLLGFVFGTLALTTLHLESVPVTLFPLLLSAFYVDATLTLLARMMKGERWWAAHRSHSYQLAVQQGRSHRQVTAGILFLSLMAAIVGVATLGTPAVHIGATAAVVSLMVLFWNAPRVAPAVQPRPRSEAGD